MDSQINDVFPRPFTDTIHKLMTEKIGQKVQLLQN